MISIRGAYERIVHTREIKMETSRQLPTVLRLAVARLERTE